MCFSFHMIESGEICDDEEPRGNDRCPLPTQLHFRQPHNWQIREDFLQGEDSRHTDLFSFLDGTRPSRSGTPRRGSPPTRYMGDTDCSVRHRSDFSEELGSREWHCATPEHHKHDGILQEMKEEGRREFVPSISPSATIFDVHATQKRLERLSKVIDTAIGGKTPMGPAQGS